MKSDLLRTIMFISKSTLQLLVLQLIGLQLLMANESEAQALKDVKVSLEVENATPVVIFEMIEEKTDFEFGYNRTVSGIQQRISTNFVNEPLDKILLYLAKEADLHFKRINKSISVILSSEDKTSNERIVELDREISGKITDAETGEALVGATVLVKGTTIGTVTDINGDFTLSIPDDTETLLVSFTGFLTKEVPIGAQTSFDVALSTNVAELGEVVVIGYGTADVNQLTTAVSDVDYSDISSQNITSFEQALSGQVPGVRIAQTNGAPGGNVSVRIRGIGSISNSHEPLYVVDGVPLDNDLRGATGTNSDLEQPTNPLSSINPRDIEKVTVLKDASATAIYGSRGSNGVVIITTKNGKSEKPSIGYSFNFGIQSVLRTVDVLDAYEYAELSIDGQNAQYLFKFPDASIDDPNSIRENSSVRIAPELYPYGNGISDLTNTDWQDEIFRDAKMETHNLSVSGKSGNGNYFVSLNYFSQEGVIINSKFDRYSARMKYNMNQGKLKFGINLSPSYTDADLVQSEGPYWRGGVVSAAQLYAPIFPVYNPDGTFNYGNNNWGFGHTNVINPVAISKLLEDRKQQFRFLGNAYLSYEISEGLEYKLSVGADANFYKRDTFSPSTLETRGRTGPSEAFGRSRSTIVTNLLADHTLTYKKSFGDHGINAVVGFSAQKNRSERNFVRVTGFPNDLVQTLNAGSIPESGFSNGSEWSLMSYFGRAQYDYKGKYLVSAAMRLDGSSRFAPNNKWGLFPSASFGWLLSEEPFIDGLSSVQVLKLRMSYGETGNFDIGNYAYIATLSSDNYVLGDSDGEIVNGLRPSNLGNDELTWETQEMLNFGLDFSLFERKLGGSFDYFISTNTGFLFNVPLPSASGYSTILENQGEIQNVGYEFTLNSEYELGPVNLYASVNFSSVKNEVKKLEGDTDQIIRSGSVGGATYITKVGEPVGSYFLYETNGVFLNQADVDANASHPDARPGDVKYVDVNGDGEITADDRTIVGNYLPDYTFGANLRATYSGFDLGIALVGVQGHEILNLHRRYSYNITGNFNQLAGAVNRWRSEEDPGDGFTVRAKSSTGRQADISTRHVEDGSFVRIQNITLGYTLPNKWLDVSRMSSARIYFSAQNPFLWTNYTGYNPEISNRPDDPTRHGEDYGSYPLTRVLSFGIDVSF